MDTLTTLSPRILTKKQFLDKMQGVLGFAGMAAIAAAETQVDGQVNYAMTYLNNADWVNLDDPQTASLLAVLESKSLATAPQVTAIIT